MNADRKMNLFAGAIGVLVIGGIATGVGVYASQPAAPATEPTPTATVEVIDPASFPVPTTPDRVIDQATSDALEAQRAAEAEAARVAAEQAAAEEAARVEAERVAAEQDAADRAAREQSNSNTGNTGNSGGGQSNPAPQAPPAPPAPIRCPAGSQATAGDGGNDTACLPEICFRITLPDAAHPECEAPFRP
jgi:type IV secretory pathway VirB10-like protein